MKPEAITAAATLAPMFRCGWLVRRSLRVFAPAWRCCSDPVPLATSNTRLARSRVFQSRAHGEFDQLFFGKIAAQLGVKLLAHRHKGQPLLI